MSWHIRGIIGVSIIFSIYDPLTRVVKSNVNFYITSGYSIASINDIVKDISGEKYRQQKTALFLGLFFVYWCRLEINRTKNIVVKIVNDIIGISIYPKKLTYVVVHEIV